MYCFSYLEPVCYSCPLVTVASWPVHRFLRRQVRWSRIRISLRIFHSLMWSTQEESRENTRPFRYDQKKIPKDYTVEVRNRFKGLDLIDRVPEELWMEVCDIIEETGIKTIPKTKKGKMVVWRGLTNHYEKKRSDRQRRKEIDIAGSWCPPAREGEHEVGSVASEMHGPTLDDAL